MSFPCYCYNVQTNVANSAFDFENLILYSVYIHTCSVSFTLLAHLLFYCLDINHVHLLCNVWCVSFMLYNNKQHEVVAIYNIYPKPSVNSNLAEYRSSKTPISVAKFASYFFSKCFFVYRLHGSFPWEYWMVMDYTMTSSNGNIFRVTGHLCRELTGHRGSPRTKVSDAELWCFLWSAPEWMVE